MNIYPESACVITRSILNFANLLLHLWAEAVATACFVQNRSILNKRLKCRPYQALNGKKPNVKFFHIFGCRCFIKNDKDHLRKFQLKCDVTFDDLSVRNSSQTHVTFHIIECDAPSSDKPTQQVIIKIEFE